MLHGFPNLTKLSLRHASCREGMAVAVSIKKMLEAPHSSTNHYQIEELTLPSRRTPDQKSNITHLNLISQDFFPMSNRVARDDLISVSQTSNNSKLKADDDVSVDATEFFAKYTPNIKELLCIKGAFSAVTAIDVLSLSWKY
jgi:hypothetical protein